MLDWRNEESTKGPCSTVIGGVPFGCMAINEESSCIADISDERTIICIGTCIWYHRIEGENVVISVTVVVK